MSKERETHSNVAGIYTAFMNKLKQKKNFII
jgi:hypothetical protein